MSRHAACTTTGATARTASGRRIPAIASIRRRQRREFRDLVDALHAAGIGVLLDVVFNHTAEGGDGGPVIHFKGMANDIFYHLDAADRRRYLDFTGCGNTVNCNHPLVTAFIVHCLEYWVEILGVDGFRFDLASVFARGDHGIPLANPPLPWAIESSRILAQVPVIAEAWDAAGLYHVGAFPGMAWSEWNGRYRDVMRRFVRGDPGLDRRSGHAPRRQRRSLRRRRPPARPTASTSSPATTASRCTIW